MKDSKFVAAAVIFFLMYVGLLTAAIVEKACQAS